MSYRVKIGKKIYTVIGADYAETFLTRDDARGFKKQDPDSILVEGFLSPNQQVRLQTIADNYSGVNRFHPEGLV